MSSELLVKNAILSDIRGDDRAKALAEGSVKWFELRESVYEAEDQIEAITGLCQHARTIHGLQPIAQRL